MKEEEVDGRRKIKGGEFIFALIATEPRNCLTSKIAPAQANYIHLLDLLPPLLFLPPPSYIASFLSPTCFFPSLSLSNDTTFPLFLIALVSPPSTRASLSGLRPSTPLWRSVFLSNKIQLGRELKRANCGQLVASLVKPSTTFQRSSYC